MDVKNDVFNSARDGKLHRLRVILEALRKEEVQNHVKAKTNGATPLIIACRNGHLRVVEYFVEKCNADIQQVGSVTFDGETIDGAPPLWCAAAAGYLNIVKLLVKAGASVNQTTFTNSTPLRAACFDGHLDIVQYLVENDANIEIANRHGHTCLMIACYKGHSKIVKYLIEKNADVNRKSLKGNTALHDCAESGSLDILQLLLSYDAKMEKDSYQMTPLLAAAVTGHTKIVEYLISRMDCQKIDKIDSLELLGATYVDRKRDMAGALKFWKQAMEERYSDLNNVLEKPKVASPIAAYENALEVASLRQLDELISDPDDMRMQALLVRERILGPAHPDTSYYIRYRGAVYADIGNFDRCITLWTYALDMQQKMLEPLSPMTQSSLLSFAELFSFMMTGNRSRPAQRVGVVDMMAVLEKAVRELEVGMTHLARTQSSDRDHNNFNRLLVIIIHLVSLVCRETSGMTETQLYNFKHTCYRLVRLNPRGTRGSTPLHLSCAKDTSFVGRYPVCAFPSVQVTNLLLEVGASINAVDNDRNTALHIAALNKPCKAEVVRTLLRHGAHLDACNHEGKDSMQFLQQNGSSINEICSPLNYLTLQCLAARQIVQHGIPYEGHIPAKLETFVQIH